MNTLKRTSESKFEIIAHENYREIDGQKLLLQQ